MTSSQNTYNVVRILFLRNVSAVRKLHIFQKTIHP